MNDQLRCEDVIRQIYDYLDRELDDGTRAAIDHHLDRCRECYSRAEFERRLRKRVADTCTAEVPDGLRERIEALLDRFGR